MNIENGTRVLLSLSGADPVEGLVIGNRLQEGEGDIPDWTLYDVVVTGDVLKQLDNMVQGQQVESGWQISINDNEILRLILPHDKLKVGHQVVVSFGIVPVEELLLGGDNWPGIVYTDSQGDQITIRRSPDVPWEVDAWPIMGLQPHRRYGG